MRFFKKLPILLEMIKFEHTIFALPFALASAVVAARGIPPLPTLGLIFLAMVGARSAAMGFNRIADRHIDAQNPRTQNRALPAGLVSLAEAWLLVAVSSALFLLAAWLLGLVAFFLSLFVLALLLGYSYTKRFTSLSHIILGLCLGLSPLGAWIAVRGSLDWLPFMLCLAVTLWTGGFDILYALQDLEFDKQAGLFSLPAKLGATPALWISRFFHFLTFVILLSFGALAHLGLLYFTGITLVGLTLFYEHRLVHPGDFSKINAAFFTMNGIVSVVFFAFTLANALLPIKI